MKLKGFKTLKEAIVYGARLEQIMNSEWGFENRRGVNVRTVTQSDDSDSPADEEVDGNMSELVARVCKQVMSEFRNTPQVQTSKTGESNKLGHMKKHHKIVLVTTVQSLVIGPMNVQQN